MKANPAPICSARRVFLCDTPSRVSGRHFARQSKAFKGQYWNVSGQTANGIVICDG